MRLEWLRLVNFMNHGDTRVEFPDAGVVVVTGDNGSGKSALSEAVAWSCWSKTIRGMSPVPPQGDKAIRAEVGFANDLVLIREKKAGKIRWTGGAHDNVAFETNTKAQRALEDQIGTFDTWSRTHFFSSEATGFARGTDAERKRLLERLIGIQRYEEAYRKCRDDLRDEQKNLVGLRHDLELLNTRAGGLQTRLDDAEDALCSFLDSGSPDQAEQDEILQRLSFLRRWSQEMDAEVSAARKDVANAAADARRAAQDVKCLSVDACPTCGQDIPDDLRDALASAYAEAKALMTQAQEEAAERSEIVAVDKKAAADEITELQERKAGIMARKAAVEQHRQAQERATALADRVEAELLKLEDTIEDKMMDVEDAQHDVDVLVSAAHVLGTKGFRAQVLGDALEGLESVANSVLDHLTGGALRVTLSSYTMTAKGKATDSIALGVTGAGGNHGYKACSTGQRRRIDVAIVLALAKLAGAAGTLWFDEVFDGLDAGGVDRLAELLGDLAEDRAVVVITHSRELAKKVRATERWHVVDGVIQ